MNAIPVIDVHTHLAGVGAGGTGCWVSERTFKSIPWRYMRRMLGLNRARDGDDVDLAYLTRLEKDLASATEHGALDAAVIFPHDRIYDDHGRQADEQEMYVPNDYAFACAVRALNEARRDGQQRPRWCFLPAMSVHPYRHDAVEETARCVELGAVAMKWLPSSQNIDGRDGRCRIIYGMLARHGVPLIVHTGGEHTVRVVRKDMCNPDAFIPALEAGVTVIMAHCGTNSIIFETDWSGRFIELARGYRNCYGDTSAFSSLGRARWARRFLHHEEIIPRLVHGSDYPVPPSAALAVFGIGLRKARELGRIWSLLERDVAIKKARGYPNVVFTNAARLLPKAAMRRWGLVVPDQT
ncbi:MAG: amidohydrolase family protein [Phycisphaerae bacterium]